VKEEQGLSAYDALLEAGQLRLRPIVMTTVAMIVGMLPIAVGGGAGGEWKSGLGWALIGGLTSSMFLTLVLVPVVYIKFDHWRTSVPAFLRRVFRIKSEQEEYPTAKDLQPEGYTGGFEGAPALRSAVQDKDAQ
jgi:HAE1 family hydrophobic/amphiphilic exporter-1